MIRYRNVLRATRADGDHELATYIERAGKDLVCADHGPVPEPIIIGIVVSTGFKIAAICPQCADAPLREKWERELHAVSA